MTSTSKDSLAHLVERRVDHWDPLAHPDQRRRWQNVSIIGVESGLGAGNPGCAAGPAMLRATAALDRSKPGWDQWSWAAPIRPIPCGVSRIGSVAELTDRLSDQVADTLRRGEFPLVVGGDHSIAIGTWSGARSVFAASERLGLLWIDAHLDSHTFSTTPSDNIHGMPLAILLGAGVPELTSIGGPAPKIRPEDVCIIGARSFEPEELDFLRALGVRIYFMPEVRDRGLTRVVGEAIGRVSDATRAYGISFDVDVLDPTQSSGTGLPVPCGLYREEVIAALTPWRCDPRCIALEIVEYNPHCDVGGLTAEAVREVCAALL